MQDASDVGRRYNYTEPGFIEVGACVKEGVVFPKLIKPILRTFRVILCLHDKLSMREVLLPPAPESSV